MRQERLGHSSARLTLDVYTHVAAVVIAPLVVALVVGGFAAWFHFHTSKRTASALKIVPFTSFAGQKFQPVFSPDGNAIAFAWKGEKDDNWDIYAKLIGAGTPLRLTTNPNADSSPAWSPDGRFIAFFRQSTTGGAYYLVPSLGGAERKLADAYSSQVVFGRLLDWSPDGKFLVAADQVSPKDSRPSIVDQNIQFSYGRVLENGICFLDWGATPPQLELFDFNTRQLKRITTVDRATDRIRQCLGPAGSPRVPQTWLCGTSS